MAKKKLGGLELGDPENKEVSLSYVINQITKEFGDGAVMKLGSTKNLNIGAISTGSISLDHALGIGGLPKGRIVEIYGAESSGKTTIALHVIAEAQKKGGLVAFIDAEHALDPVYAKAIGVDIDELLISQPDSGEQALTIADLLIRSSALDVIVIDSVAALVPKSEIEGEITDQQMGLQARLMSKGLRKLTGSISKTNTVVIFINQIREKIGGMPGFGGPATTTSGGRALKFFSSVRMEVKKGTQIKQGEEAVGVDVIVKVTKNKVAPPFKEARFSFAFGKGISREGEIIDLAIELDLIKKSGSWFSYNSTKLGQGKLNVEELLSKNLELRDEIEAKVRELVNAGELENKKKKKKNDKSSKEEVVVEVENENSEASE